LTDYTARRDARTGNVQLYPDGKPAKEARPLGAIGGRVKGMCGIAPPSPGAGAQAGG